MKYHILTYGCQMNVRDSETIGGLLEAAGHTPVDTWKDADLVVFNTCSVRHSAEDKVLGKLGEINRARRQKPGIMVAFGGCMAQIPEIREKLKKMKADIVFGTYNLHELPEMVDLAIRDAAPVHRVWDEAGPVLEGLPARRRSGFGAFVNIMFGCNNFCSYCIVPYVRGRERSRRPADIMDEVKRLVADGVVEVTLLGQNVNSYGRGLEEEIDFAGLLEMANDVPGLQRIRFTTSHPRDMSDRLIRAVAELDRVCEHIHVPMQAGSNRILKLMNRGYTRDRYFRLVEKMREMIPGVAVTSDLIVGFPGEKAEDFEATLEAVEKVRFDAAFTFMYSPRSGTKACDLPGQVEREEKLSRLLRLNELQYAIALERNQNLIGTEVEVLVEGRSKTNKNRMTGRTRDNRILIFDGEEDLAGRMCRVRVKDASTFTLFGDLEQETDG